MEKAILKTLVYADLFDYPLKVWEIHKWLISKKADLPDVEKVLNRKKLLLKIKHQGDFYYLKGRKKILLKRLEREKQSAKFLREVKFITNLFKVLPGVLLVGVSGGLAMENAEKNDDIDLFVICKKDWLWISRMGMLSILSFIGKRRKRGEEADVSGKICLNLLLEEDKLEQRYKDLYTAHEVLQMKVLWQRGDIYSKFLMDNEWVFEFLPNWRVDSQVREATLKIPRQSSRISKDVNPPLLLGVSEGASKWLQKRYMGEPEGKERLGEGELYFHPQDIREKILTEFKRRYARISK